MRSNPALATTPILIIGLGNPILGDDGVGWKVAEQVQAHLANLPENEPLLNYEIDFLSVGGLSLMERMVGYDAAILIDAIQTDDPVPGRIVHMKLEQIPNRAWGHLTSSHDTTLQNALEVGRKMGARLPHTIWVVGIEAQLVFEFAEILTPAIAAAIPEAMRIVLEHLVPSPEAVQR
jgi:hydrogenase maturation protease